MKLTAKNTNFNIFRSSHHLSYVIIIIIIIVYLFIYFNFFSLSLKSSFYASLTVLFLLFELKPLLCQLTVTFIFGRSICMSNLTALLLDYNK